MADVRLADVYVRELFDASAMETSLRKSALFGAGAVAVDSDLSDKVGANDGTTFTSKFYRDLEDNEPDYIDDSDTAIVPDKVAIGDFTARKVMAAKSWSEKDVVRLVTMMQDPLNAIGQRVSAYWGRYYDRYALASLNGAIADNVANDAGDMGIDISAGVGAAGQISAEAIIDAMATSGDHYEDYTVMIVHSRIAAALRKNNLIVTIPGSEANTTFQYYQHLRMIVTDSITTDGAAAPNTIFHTYFMRGPVVMFGASNNGLISSELYRDPLTGKGGGATSLITRRQFAMQPIGFSFQADVTNNTPSPNLVDMEKAGNWDRTVLDRKAIPFSYLICKSTS